MPHGRNMIVETWNTFITLCALYHGIQSTGCKTLHFQHASYSTKPKVTKSQYQEISKVGEWTRV